MDGCEGERNGERESGKAGGQEGRRAGKRVIESVNKIRDNIIRRSKQPNEPIWKQVAIQSGDFQSGGAVLKKSVKMAPPEQKFR